jgi:hypothetical protein
MQVASLDILSLDIARLLTIEAEAFKVFLCFVEEPHGI